MRMNICEPVPMPRSWKATLAWIATRKVVLQNPIPIPAIKPALAGHSQWLPGSRKASITAATTSDPPPTDAVSR
jgi:hypothetical protein